MTNLSPCLYAGRWKGRKSGVTKDVKLNRITSLGPSSRREESLILCGMIKEGRKPLHLPVRRQVEGEIERGDLLTY